MPRVVAASSHAGLLVLGRADLDLLRRADGRGRSDAEKALDTDACLEIAGPIGWTLRCSLEQNRCCDGKEHCNLPSAAHDARAETR